MRNDLLGGVAAVALAVTMISQPVAAAEKWTGFYIGGHLGVGQSDWSGQWDPSESPNVNFDDVFGEDGLVGGMQAGYNYQFSPAQWGSFVLGAEIDFSSVSGMSSDNNIEGRFGSDGSVCHPNFTAQCGESIDWLASFRGRLGVAFDDVHIYGTAGPALADANAFVSSSSTGQTFNFNDVGLAWGGGLEWMAMPNLVIGAEFLQYRFNDSKNVLFEDGSDAENIMEFDAVNVIRIRLSYKF